MTLLVRVAAFGHCPSGFHPEGPATKHHPSPRELESMRQQMEDIAVNLSAYGHQAADVFVGEEFHLY
jgi:hypothetical protein